MNRLLAKLSLLILTVPAFLGAATITWNGPQDPATGAICTPGVGNCVVGNPLTYNIFSVSLTNPAGAGDKWKLEILTNYGATLPGGSVAVPTFSYEGRQYGMADFMIQVGTTAYGVVLSSHDGLLAGNLYQSGVALPVGPNTPNALGQVVTPAGLVRSRLQAQTGFLSSDYVLGGTGPVPNSVSIPRPLLPALLNPTGATLIGAGAITASATGGNGVSQALYRISVEFSAPVNFLGSDKFQIYASSFVCDNGYISGAGDPFTSGGDIPQIPEPSTYVMLVSGLSAVAFSRFRRN